MGASFAWTARLTTSRAFVHACRGDHARRWPSAPDQQAQAHMSRDLELSHVRFHGRLSDMMGTLRCHKEELL